MYITSKHSLDPSASCSARSKEKPEQEHGVLSRPTKIIEDTTRIAVFRHFPCSHFTRKYSEKSRFDSRLLMKSRFTRKEKTSHFTFHEKKKLAHLRIMKIPFITRPWLRVSKSRFVRLSVFILNFNEATYKFPRNL